MAKWDEDFGQRQDDSEPDVWEAQAERIRRFEAWQAQCSSRPSVYHGRVELLTVDDIKFLIACGIDPLA